MKLSPDPEEGFRWLGGVGVYSAAWVCVGAAAASLVN